MYLQQSERIMETHRWLFNVITKRIQGADMAFKEGWGSVLSSLVVLIQTIKHQSKRRPEFKIILSMFALRDLFRVDSKSVSLFVFFHFLLDVPSTLATCLFFAGLSGHSATWYCTHHLTPRSIWSPENRSENVSLSLLAYCWCSACPVQEATFETLCL